MPITIHLDNLEPASVTWIEDEAERRGVTVEQVALELVQRGIKLFQLETYHELDDLAGTWSNEEADAFLKAVAPFEQVDEELWT
jgi:hypothetical protein